MATSQEFIEYVCEQIRELNDVRYKKMFGEYMVYIDDKPLLLVCDNTVYVKMLPCLDEMTFEIGIPYKGAKEHYILDIDNSNEANDVIRLINKNTPAKKAKQTK